LLDRIRNPFSGKRVVGGDVSQNVEEPRRASADQITRLMLARLSGASLPR
jgi:hypothetical protein